MQIRLDRIGVMERASYISLPVLNLEVRRRNDAPWQTVKLYYVPDDGWDILGSMDAVGLDDDEFDEIYEWVASRIKCVLLALPIAEVETTVIYSHGLLKHALEDPNG